MNPISPRLGLLEFFSVRGGRVRLERFLNRGQPLLGTLAPGRRSQHKQQHRKTHHESNQKRDTDGVHRASSRPTLRPSDPAG
jgi:hypothetical protein